MFPHRVGPSVLVWSSQLNMGGIKNPQIKITQNLNIGSLTRWPCYSPWDCVSDRITQIKCSMKYSLTRHFKTHAARAADSYWDLCRCTSSVRVVMVELYITDSASSGLNQDCFSNLSFPGNVHLFLPAVSCIPWMQCHAVTLVTELLIMLVKSSKIYLVSKVILLTISKVKMPRHMMVKVTDGDCWTPV